jgi:hypothetical protein
MDLVSSAGELPLILAWLFLPREKDLPASGYLCRAENAAT